MMRSLYSGVSGLRNHQTRMDSSATTLPMSIPRFQGQPRAVPGRAEPEITGAASAQATAAAQTRCRSASAWAWPASTPSSPTFLPAHRQGTDLSIQGQGFFILSNGNQKIYTRAGNFDFDSDGNYLLPGTG
jgi:flagellar hook protein FlgE